MEQMGELVDDHCLVVTFPHSNMRYVTSLPGENAECLCHGLIEVWSGRSDRARKRNQRAIAFTHKYETWAIFVTYLPIPMPAAVVYAALGAAGTKLSKFLIVSFISSVISSGLKGRPATASSMARR